MMNKIYSSQTHWQEMTDQIRTNKYSVYEFCLNSQYLWVKPDNKSQYMYWKPTNEKLTPKFWQPLEERIENRFFKN